MSGKAIDLRQSVTTVQTADIFAQTKEAELQIVKIAMGREKRSGFNPSILQPRKGDANFRQTTDKKEFVQIQPEIKVSQCKNKLSRIRSVNLN